VPTFPTTHVLPASHVLTKVPDSPTATQIIVLGQLIENRSVPAPESTVESLLAALIRGPRVDPEFLETVETITRTQPKVPRSPWDE